MKNAGQHSKGEESGTDYALSFDWQTYEDLAFTEKFVCRQLLEPRLRKKR